MTAFHTNRRNFIIGSLLASTSLSAFGPAMAQQAADVQPVKGGILTYVVFSEPTRALVNIVSAGALKFGAKTNEGLLTYDLDLNPLPQLAVEWDMAEDGLTYTFKLRPNVKWHDGEPFTSEDVKTSLTLLRKGHPRSQAVVTNIAEIETPDPLTVILHMSEPAPYLIYGLAAAEMPIVAAHLYDVNEDAGENPVSKAPIGTGPFMFKEWVRGSHIIYERNPNYWDGDKPYVDGVVFRIITDQGARAAAYETGEVLIGDETPVSYTDIARLTAEGTDLAVTTDGYATRNGVTRLNFNLDHEIFSNLKVRQAVELAIDKQRLIDTAWFGFGNVGRSPISSGLSRYFLAVENKAVDLDKANALLDEAGYPKDADGIRFEAKFHYYPGFSAMKGQAEFIRSELAKVGIKVNVVTLDFATYVKTIYTDRDFEFYTTANNCSFDPTVGVQRNFISTGFQKGVPFSNGTHYHSEIVDAALIAAAGEPNEKKRRANFETFQKQVNLDLPSITLTEINHVTLYNKSVHGHSDSAEGLWGNLSGVFITK